jgi:hypothetical protein
MLVSSQGLFDLLEGMNLHQSFNKRLDSSLKSIIKSNSSLVYTDNKLLVKVIEYLGDVDSKIDDKLKTILD